MSHFGHFTHLQTKFKDSKSITLLGFMANHIINPVVPTYKQIIFPLFLHSFSSAFKVLSPFPRPLPSFCQKNTLISLHFHSHLTSYFRCLLLGLCVIMRQNIHQKERDNIKEGTSSDINHQIAIQ